MNYQMSENVLRQESALRYFTGILGGLLGALVGAVPWFLVATFTGFFVGWLGFLVAWCSYFGYRLFRGVKNKAFALSVIIICSVAAIIFSDFCGNMVALCRDADWQATAAQYGVSVAELAFVSITATENLSILLPNLLIGLAIGVLGIISIRKQVAAYVAPAVSQQDAAPISVSVPDGEQYAPTPASPATLDAPMSQNIQPEAQPVAAPPVRETVQSAAAVSDTVPVTDPSVPAGTQTSCVVDE